MDFFLWLSQLDSKPGHAKTDQDGETLAQIRPEEKRRNLAQMTATQVLYHPARTALGQWRKMSLI